MKKLLAIIVSVAYYFVVTGLLLGSLGEEISLIKIGWFMIVIWTFIFASVWFLGYETKKQLDLLEGRYK